MTLGDQLHTSFWLFKKLHKWLQMVKVAGLKARNAIKRRLKHRYFAVNFTQFFPKTLFTEHFWMTAFADSSVPTKVLPHFYDQTFFVFSFMFPFIIDIACKGIPTHPLFYDTHPLTQLAPHFKIFVCPPLFSVPSPFKVFQTVLPHPHITLSCPNLTNQLSLI